MKIVVLVKEVPDTYGERHLDLETGLARRDAGERVPDEIGERALEVALRYAETAPGTDIVVLTMGPEAAAGSIRRLLAMGAESAVQVTDADLVGADLLLTAEVLAAALRRIGFDLVVAGSQSTDGAGGVLPAMLAEVLDVAQATNLEQVDIGEGSLTGRRAGEGVTLAVQAGLPAVISITEALPDPRFASFKGIMAAKKKEIEVLRLADLGVDALPTTRPSSILLSISQRPARAAGTTITDEGDAGLQLADFLVSRRLA